MLEPGICIGSVRQRSDLQQKNHHKPGDENAADLPQNKFQVRPSCQPPPGGDMRAIPARMVLGVAGGGPGVAHFAPRGIKKDLYRSMVAVSLYCWIAPAGSTCLGQTCVHSPTNVHPQIPSCWASTSMRSCAPSSRESMLKRCASAIAAGPLNPGSSPCHR